MADYHWGRCTSCREVIRVAYAPRVAFRSNGHAYFFTGRCPACHLQNFSPYDDQKVQAILEAAYIAGGMEAAQALIEAAEDAKT